MKNCLVIGLAAVAALVFGTFTGTARAAGFECDEAWSLCAEPANSIGYAGTYTGHDEPSLLFYSNAAGSGNSTLYQLTLPTEPKTLPTQNGTGGTWNFQLHPAFWFGMALCDNQSAPEYTHAPCAPDSDANIFDGTNPNAADYIGKHPGTAFLELQFYPPGWAPWPPGVSCDATRWCAAVAMFSLNLDQNTNTPNNADCLNTVGIEPLNFAFITKNGVPHGPPGPLDLTNGSFTPSPVTDLFMNQGDRLVVDIHDSPAGLVTVIRDLTTGQSGFMTASAANGFAQIKFQPHAAKCSESPYAFRPMYATSSEHTRVPWAAHSYNVAFSDEIGHFEYCSAVAGKAATAGQRQRDPGRRRRRLRLLQRRLLDCSSRSEAASPPTATSTGSVPEGLAGNGSEPRAGRQVPPHLGPVHEPALQRHPELQPCGFRDRPAADRGAGLRRHLRSESRERTA